MDLGVVSKYTDHVITHIHLYFIEYARVIISPVECYLNCLRPTVSGNQEKASEKGSKEQQRTEKRN